jgi:hypothetical protein
MISINNSINKISLVGNIMPTFIDHKLFVMKQAHNKFMGNLDVIMTNDFLMKLH